MWHVSLGQPVELDAIAARYWGWVDDIMWTILTAAGIGVGAALAGGVLGAGAALAHVWAAFTWPANVFFTFEIASFGSGAVLCTAMSMLQHFILPLGACLIAVPARLSRGVGGFLCALYVANAVLLRNSMYISYLIAAALSGVSVDSAKQQLESTLQSFRNVSQDWTSVLTPGGVTWNPNDLARALLPYAGGLILTISLWGVAMAALSRAFGGVSERLSAM